MFWSYELKKLSKFYLLALISAFPWAAIYAYLSLKGLDSWQSTTLLLVAALVTAKLLWRILEKRVLKQEGAIHLVSIGLNKNTAANNLFDRFSESEAIPMLAFHSYDMPEDNTASASIAQAA